MVRHGDERLVVGEARANGEALEPIHLKEPGDTGNQQRVTPSNIYREDQLVGMQSMQVISIYILFITISIFDIVKYMFLSSIAIVRLIMMSL